MNTTLSLWLNLVSYAMLILQSSALWASLLLVLFMMSMVFNTMTMTSLSGLFGMFLLMVFVGSLLILLVGVSTLSFQDQSIKANFCMITIIGVFWLMTPHLNSMEIESLSVMIWLEVLTLFAIQLLIILSQGFLSLTLLLLNFKTSSRLM